VVIAPLLALALAAPPPPQLPTGLEPAMRAAVAWFVVAEAADYGTTQVALKRGRYEGNPVMQWSADNPWQMLAVKAGVTVGFSWLMVKLHPQHPKLTLGLTVGVAGLLTAVAAHNLYLARRP